MMETLKIKSREMHLTYEVARFQAFFAVLPHQGKKSQMKKPSDLVTFEWERKTEKAERMDLSPKNVKKLFATMNPALYGIKK